MFTKYHLLPILLICIQTQAFTSDLIVDEYSNIEISCESNKFDHLFSFWHFIDRNIIIGPSNEYNLKKYKFQALSGNLTIKAASVNDNGTYACVSQGVRSNEINIRQVRLIVNPDKENNIGEIIRTCFENFVIKFWYWVGAFLIIFALIYVSSVRRSEVYEKTGVDENENEALSDKIRPSVDEFMVKILNY